MGQIYSYAIQINCRCGSDVIKQQVSSNREIQMPCYWLLVQSQHALSRGPQAGEEGGVTFGFRL